MTQIIIDRHQVELAYETDCMIMRIADEPPRSIPLGRVEQLVCLHNVQLSTQLIGQLHKRGIDLIVLNLRYERNSFTLFANPQRQVERRCIQYQWQLEEAIRLPIAQALCRHKFKTACQALATCPSAHSGQTITRLRDAALSLHTCQNEAQLRGIEGSQQRQLFQCWREQLPATLGFTRRQRRPPPDPVNATLSLAYTLVYQEAVRQARRFGLDPQLGFYHRTAYGRYSLACDLMEPVRPLIEAWVVGLFQSGTLSKRCFSHTQQGCLLGKAGRAAFYGAFDSQILHWRRKLAAGARWLIRRVDQSRREALDG